MATNQYLPFATSDNANVLTSDEYNNLSARGNGFQSGVASSTQVNTPIRQATVIASAVAQYIADTSNTNMLDDGNVSSVVSALKNTINNSSSDKLPITGGTITGKTTISYSAPELDLMAGSNSYVMRIFSASTSAGFAFTGTDNSVKTRIRFTRSTETINIENSKLTIDGASVLTTSGGTVSGNTNFTGKLQQAGNDVITTANVSSYVTPNVEYWYVNGSESSPLTITTNQEIVINDPYVDKSVLLIPQIYITGRDGESRWIDCPFNYENQVSWGVSVNQISGSIYIIGSSTLFGKDKVVQGLPTSILPSGVISSASFRIKIIK